MAESLYKTTDLEERADIRSDIDTAMSVFNFLEELDADSPMVLQIGMKEEVIGAKKECLKIITKWISLLGEAEP